MARNTPAPSEETVTTDETGVFDETLNGSTETIEETQEVTELKDGKVNPFDTGVTYADFLTALGKEKVSDYCKDFLTADQIEWLENDLKIYQNQK